MDEYAEFRAKREAKLRWMGAFAGWFSIIVLGGGSVLQFYLRMIRMGLIGGR